MISPRRFVRNGFSMMEIMVALAILAVLTATLFPMLMSKVQDARRAALSQTLLAISQGTAEYRKAVTRYPPNITVLTTAPTAGVTTDACGGTNFLSVINAANWRGPYLSREMLSTGLKMADGTVSSTLSRIVGPPSFLLINVTGIEERIARDLEDEFDGNANPSSGTIRYTPASPPAGTTVTLSYAIPISGC